MPLVQVVQLGLQATQAVPESYFPAWQRHRPLVRILKGAQAMQFEGETEQLRQDETHGLQAKLPFSK